MKPFQSFERSVRPFIRGEASRDKMLKCTSMIVAARILVYLEMEQKEGDARKRNAREMAKIVNLFVRHAFLISRIINED